MRQPSKAEVMERNVKLSRQNDAMMLLLIDLFRGEAALQTQGNVTWLISRPGSGGGGCAAIYTRHAGSDSIDTGTIEDLAAHATRARSYAYSAAPEDQDRLHASANLGSEAERINRIGMADGCAPKLPSILGDFHRVKLGVR